MKGRTMLRAVLRGPKLVLAMVAAQFVSYAATGNGLAFLDVPEHVLAWAILGAIGTWLAWNLGAWAAERLNTSPALDDMRRAREELAAHEQAQAEVYRRMLAASAGPETVLSVVRALSGAGALTGQEAAWAQHTVAFASFTPGHGLPALRYVSPPVMVIVCEEEAVYEVKDGVRFPVITSIRRADQQGLQDRPGDCMACGRPRAVHLHYSPLGRCETIPGRLLTSGGHRGPTGKTCAGCGTGLERHHVLGGKNFCPGCSRPKFFH